MTDQAAGTEDVDIVDLMFDIFVGDIGKRSAGLVRAGGMLVGVAGPPEARPIDGLAVDSLSYPIARS